MEKGGFIHRFLDEQGQVGCDRWTKDALNVRRVVFFAFGSVFPALIVLPLLNIYVYIQSNLNDAEMDRLSCRYEDFMESHLRTLVSDSLRLSVSRVFYKAPEDQSSNHPCSVSCTSTPKFMKLSTNALYTVRAETTAASLTTTVQFPTRSIQTLSSPSPDTPAAVRPTSHRNQVFRP
jgi:hypothetical protein